MQISQLPSVAHIIYISIVNIIISSMGGEQSNNNPKGKTSNNRSSIVSDIVHLSVDERDNRMGQVTKCMNKSSKQLMWMKESAIPTELKLEIEDYVTRCKNNSDYMKLFNTSSLNLIKEDSKIGYCTHEQYILLIVMDYYEKTLEEEIAQRAAIQSSKQKMFKEDEIWMMFEAIQEIELFYQRINISFLHSDVRMSNIFIVEDGSIKFLDIRLVTWRQTGFMKATLFGTFIPLSPELMKELKEEVPNENVSPSNEVWTIGIVMLCMATLKPDTEFYDWKQKKLLTNRIESALEFVRSKYSSKLVDFIGSCLKENPKQRKQMKELLLVSFPSQIF